MTHPEVLQAYKDKYSAFPDLVARIVSQFDYDFWERYNSSHDIDIENFNDWHKTKEGDRFWEYLYDYDVDKDLTRESIDAAYREFGIEPLTPGIDMMKFVEESYYWPLFSHLSEQHGLTLIDTEMDDIVNIVKGMGTVKTSE